MKYWLPDMKMVRFCVGLFLIFTLVFSYISIAPQETGLATSLFGGVVPFHALVVPGILIRLFVQPFEDHREGLGYLASNLFIATGFGLLFGIILFTFIPRVL